MSIEANTALALRYFEAFDHPDVFDAILSDDFQVHPIHRATLSGDSGRGTAAFKADFRELLNSFPDSRVRIDMTIAQDDRVMVLWTYEGTQQGEFAGIPASNRHVTYRGCNIFRVENGKLVEGWDLIDRLAMWQLLGVLPETRDFVQAAAARSR
jgi:steroid delta-isomerase-like uncharacterized protein